MADKTTRRRFLTGSAALIAVGIAGCTDMENARQDMTVATHDRLPTRESNWNEDLEMALSGWRLYTREGAEAHTVDIARLGSDGEWFHDEVDLVQWGGPDGDLEGEPVDYACAEDLAEGGTVVLLRARNDRGKIISPDFRREHELHVMMADSDGGK